ncbi:L-ascorbate oxidase-like protein [Gossypium australe]|uniref:L-ascorbate oxidase-like protein n=1 Tax=Gossypium australe TaxID=47621 RepID=A0A5B6WYE6_9ROSI|nr:L-ascorbate oxidase-like protein [Gossypium australe]KAA3485955.1 L-ascorbate oxidase-like protein [Gossypium australe]
MAPLTIIAVFFLWVGSLLMVQGGDPTISFEWKVTYGTISPLGVPVKGILINGQFPGPNINSTTNNNVIVNVFNNLDEPFLLTWSGVQHRKNPWQDGVLGTNCPIPPGTNYTYKFQVKDQIGSYMYYPVTGMHKAAGGFGGLRINSRLLIPVPYADPADDYTIIAGDFFNKGHTTLKKILDSGRNLGRCDGVHINGKVAKGDGSDEPLFTMEAGKTYKYRICNAGLKTSLNVRFQGHNMKLVEMEGSHTVQNDYESLDVHVGQCFGVLVTADQEPKDYFFVASTRFTKREVTATGVIRYTNGKGAPSPKLPPPPVGWAWSLNQFRTFRWNLTASAARPNPQGSYKYGSVNITRTIKLANTAQKVDGKLRYAINGASYVEPTTPLKLAEYYGVADKVFKYDTIPDDPPAEITKVTMEPVVLNLTHRNFMEIIFENRETAIQTYHLCGYAFFAVGIEPGQWSPEKRKNYNLLDAMSRHTIQVFPKCWAAILLSFDNCGMWNIRSEVWDRRYLGQQLYVSVLSPNKSLRDEYNMPEGALVCGAVENMPRPPPRYT